MNARAWLGRIIAVLRWLGPGHGVTPHPIDPALVSGRLAALGASYPLPTWRPLAQAVMVMLGLFLAWTFYADLDEVATATGEVVPEGKVKVIQHLEGGVVREISVADGCPPRPGSARSFRCAWMA